MMWKETLGGMLLFTLFLLGSFLSIFKIYLLCLKLLKLKISMMRRQILVGRLNPGPPACVLVGHETIAPQSLSCRKTLKDSAPLSCPKLQPLHECPSSIFASLPCLNPQPSLGCPTPGLSPGFKGTPVTKLVSYSGNSMEILSNKPMVSKESTASAPASRRLGNDHYGYPI